MEKLFTSQEASKRLNIRYYGESWNYEAALEEQLLVYEEVEARLKSYAVLSGVHLPVYTLGNSLKVKPDSKTTIPFVHTDRGGQLMYHGPGQLTIYPIFKLKDFFSGPRDYSKYIFDTAIKFYKFRYGLTLKCRNNGLWLENKKVGFLGLRIKNGITYHGLSVNYCADLDAFKMHSPCDISGHQAGNLFRLPFLMDFDFETEALELSKAVSLKLTK